VQQVGTSAILASAEAVDPRRLPVIVRSTGQRALVAITHTWVLHRKRVLQAMLGVVALVLVVVGWETRDTLAVGVQNLRALIEGEVAEAGFGISKINLTGQNITTEAEIVQALAIEPRITTLNYDAEAARARLLELPAVATASVRKIYPGEVEVTITEKEPVARWRVDGVTFLVDMNGEQIAQDDGSFTALPLIVGDGAADDAMPMIRAMARYDALKSGLAALSRIGDRRWDLIYYTGLRVQLPELGVAQALSKLETYQERYALLDRDVTLIDLRVPGMVAIKRGALATQMYEAALKDKKKKKPMVQHAIDPSYASPGAGHGD
jgi:cell division protein FtsQ